MRSNDDPVDPVLPSIGRPIERSRSAWDHPPMPLAETSISQPRTPIQSSVLRAVLYSASSRRLEAEFQSGAVYIYDDVPHQVFLDLLAAPSKGTFFNREIRNNYGYVRLRAPS